MLYRALDMNDDATFCSGSTFFYDNDPQAVAQLVKTNLRLIQGEWFLDETVGVPYNTQVLGTGTAPTRDSAIQTAILQTQGVSEIVSYNSVFYGPTRTFTVSATIATIYSSTPIEITVNL
jgi:hypothetical protein